MLINTRFKIQHSKLLYRSFSLEIFDETGPVDYLYKLDDFDDAYCIVEQDAGYNLLGNVQDRSFRAALRLAGWDPTGNAQAGAVDWYEMDYEYAQTPISVAQSAFINLDKSIAFPYLILISARLTQSAQDVPSEQFTVANFVSLALRCRNFV